MTINAPAAPPLPSLNDPANFNAKALALFSWQVSEYIPWLESLAGVTENGAINGTPIGPDTPAAGRFSTLSVGAASSEADLYVQAGSISRAWAPGGGTTALFESNNATSAAVTIAALSTANCDLRFGDEVSDSAGMIRYSNAENSISIRTLGVERLKIDSSGRIGMGAAPISSQRVYINDTADANGVRQDYTHASYASTASQITVARSASSEFSFLRFYSGGFADREFNFRGDGTALCDGSWTGGGADFAEWFEWADGNPGVDDRRGVSVVLDGDKIRPALAGEAPFGVISAAPAVIGDGDMDRWKGKYLRDDFGAYVLEAYEAIQWTEEVVETEAVEVQATEEQTRIRATIEVVGGTAVRKIITETVQAPLFNELPLMDEAGGDLGTYRVPRMVTVEREVSRTDELRSYAADEVPEGVTVPADAERVTQQRRKLNPDFDPSLEYTSREDRPEWDLVGLVGKLRLRKGQPVDARWIKMRDVSEGVEQWLIR